MHITLIDLSPPALPAAYLPLFEAQCHIHVLTKLLHPLEHSINVPCKESAAAHGLLAAAKTGSGQQPGLERLLQA